ncbi:hypothetical protein EXU85_14500 [Spirosoma sp. KCTC 42546]|uniref:hypothetical protein n=1 Tax=Spirosoma sp. KCTC 42546 TaxID=2520506 RepID=UPI00115BEBEF|nr:hypothetical protein [Spirosoma sp. KCTC 42546]QDK79754.1 hypothetical protein EXU85_14500 [Spirosoma sp. KCTC 42546]
MNKKKFKSPINEIKKVGSKFHLDEKVIQMPDLDYPVFCFKHIHPDYSIERLSQEEKSALLDAIYKRGKMSWNDLQLSNRHKLGSAKIAIDSIKAGLPNSVTGDIEFLLAFRYFNMKPFLGYRNRFIFHIVFIDYQRDVYDHG